MYEHEIETNSTFYVRSDRIVFNSFAQCRFGKNRLSYGSVEQSHSFGLLKYIKWIQNMRVFKLV